MADLTPTLTLHSMEKAGAPANAVRTIKDWAESNLVPGSTGYASTLAKAKMHATEFAGAVRSTGEGAVFGAILGGLNATLPQGLDFPIPGTKAHLPLDGAGALVGIAAATFAAAEPYGIGRTLANGAASCSTVYSFRKMNDLVLSMRSKKAGITPGGGAAPLAGKIGKATFTGEGGWAEGSISRAGSQYEDVVVQAARGL